MLDNPPTRATLGRGNGSPAYYDICLMLTRIYLGYEDERTARELYRVFRLRRANGRRSFRREWA